MLALLGLSSLSRTLDNFVVVAILTTFALIIGTVMRVPQIWWVRKDSNLLSTRQGIYSPPQLAVVAAHPNCYASHALNAFAQNSTTTLE